MKRKLFAAVAGAGVAFAGWHWLGPQVPDAPAHSDGPAALDPRSEELARVRLNGRIAELDRWIDAQRQRAQAGDAGGWRLLAEGLLERVLARTSHRGLVPGEPLFDELPAALRQDLDDAGQAIAAARTAGDDSAETYRIEASLLGNRITGLASALRLSGRIESALRAAVERDAGHPRLQIALGCRCLFAPALLGRDLVRARAHLEAGARGLPLDERPLLFLALLDELEGNRDQAIARLQEAVGRNPQSRFARTVLDRLQAGEADAFARDL